MMAAVDAYSPCPCGSGQKYKWCCQKAESYVERAERLDRNGQHEAALGVVADGLAKHPDAPWLYLRKAVAHLELEQGEKAIETLEALLARQPDHFGALVLAVRTRLETADFAAAVDRFQDALGRAEGTEGRRRLGALAALVGGVLVQGGLAAAGVKHMELAQSLTGDDSSVEPVLSRARANPSASAWTKNPYPLSGPPHGLSDEARGRFEEALRWAEQGLWRQAAAAFELLSADRNVGLCRLWTADHKGAVEALRRSVRDQSQNPAGKPTIDAVDLEALCQTIDDAVGDDPVEEVELTWPIRDRGGLIDRLAADPRCVETAPEELEGGGVRRSGVFLLLDRPALAGARPDLKPSDVPRVVGRIVVGADVVALETRDDGRLDRHIDGFAAAAGATIPPAHPRTRPVGTIARVDHVLDVVCYPPADLSRLERERITTAILAEQVDRHWTETPMPYLAGKTPLQAARAGGFEAPLRAALLLLEESGRAWEPRPDWTALRTRLNLAAEPPIDHAAVDVAALHLGRLALLDPRRLDDDRLFAVHQRARTWGQADLVPIFAREITARRGLLERPGFPIHSVYSELALNEAVAARREPALEWARKGRAVDPRGRESSNAAAWDMLDVEVRMAFDPPDAWVPELAVVMARYEKDAEGTRAVLMQLIRLGLVEPTPTEEAGRVALDMSLLQQLIAEYGPRVQTVTGEVGVSAVRSGIWTPGGGTGGGGVEKPRIIVPGRG